MLRLPSNEFEGPRSLGRLVILSGSVILSETKDLVNTDQIWSVSTAALNPSDSPHSLQASRMRGR